MGSNKIITLMDDNREVDSVEVICAFEIPKLLGKYILYTKNEKDNDGNTIIYSGKISKTTASSHFLCKLPSCL